MKLPVGMKTVNLEGCEGVHGDLAQMKLPVGMETVALVSCEGVHGDLRE